MANRLAKNSAEEYALERIKEENKIAKLLLMFCLAKGVESFAEKSTLIDFL